jgi:hypothetical protein
MKIKALVVVALLFLTTAAVADTFNLTAVGTGITLTATLTGTASGGGLFNLTGMTGTVNGMGVSGLLATSSPGTPTNSAVVNGWYITYDNVLNMNTPYFDLYGLGFALNDGTLANLYYSQGYLYGQLGSNPPTPWTSVNVSVTNPDGTQVPEPASLTLFGCGLLALGARMRKRH